MNALKKVGGFLKKHLKPLIVVVIIIAVVLVLRYRAQKAREAIEAEANKPVTANVEKMDLQQSVSVTGTLSATDTATVTSTIGGTGVTGIKVSKVNYKEGDYVEAGTVVVEFDGDDYNRKIAELNAKYNLEDKKSTQSIQDTQNSIADTQKKIDDAQKTIEDDQKWLAENEKYYLNLKDAKDAYLLHPNYDDVKARWESEQTICSTMYGVTIEGYEAKQKEVESLQDSIITYQNTIASYQLNIEVAQLQQKYDETYTRVDAKDDVYESMEKTQVSAPISGYIITMNVEEGNNYSQGNTVFTIADTSEFVVEATVNEYDIANIKEDLPAVIKFEATGDEEFDGQVTFVSVASESTVSSAKSSTAAAGFGSTAASTSSSAAAYKIKIKLDETDDRLRVGMTAKASVILNSTKDAWAVPYDCLQQDEEDNYFITEIKDDGTKNNISVTKGLESDYYVEIKGEGLQEGMTVEAVVNDAPSTDIMDYMYMY